MKKPEYKAGKGLKFTRYGGLTPRRQKNKAAPVSKGLWAFIYPYFDWFFLSGEMSNIEGRFRKVSPEDKHKERVNSNLLKHFYYQGPVFVRFDMPSSGENSKYDGSENGWTLTHTDDLKNYLPKLFAKDVSAAREGYTSSVNWVHNPATNDFDRVVKRVSDIKHNELQDATRNPYGFISTDHYEVFIPAPGALDSQGRDVSRGEGEAVKDRKVYPRISEDTEKLCKTRSLVSAMASSSSEEENLMMNEVGARKTAEREGSGIVFLCPKTSRVFLVKRSMETHGGPGTWAGIGGAIDPGENPEATARREAREEIGHITMGPLVLLHVWKNPNLEAAKRAARGQPDYAQPIARYYNFLAPVAKEFDDVRLNWENDDSGWFAVDNLPSPLHPGIEEIRGHLIKAAKQLKPKVFDRNKGLVSEGFLMQESLEELAQYPDGFSIETLEAQPSLAAKVRYLNQFGLARLGEGSSRIAFANPSSPEIALKIAKNAKGLAQNKIEILMSQRAKNEGFEDLVAQVLDTDSRDHGLWVEAERSIRQPSPADWQKNFGGLRFRETMSALWSVHRWRDREPDSDRALERLSNSAFYSQRERAVFRQILSIPKAMMLIKFVVNSNLTPGDIMRPSSWGVIRRDGKEEVVLVDYGLDDTTLNKMYKRR